MFVTKRGECINRLLITNIYPSSFPLLSLTIGEAYFLIPLLFFSNLPWDLIWPNEISSHAIWQTETLNIIAWNSLPLDCVSTIRKAWQVEGCSLKLGPRMGRHIEQRFRELIVHTCNMRKKEVNFCYKFLWFGNFMFHSMNIMVPSCQAHFVYLENCSLVEFLWSKVEEARYSLS